MPSVPSYVSQFVYGWVGGKKKQGVWQAEWVFTLLTRRGWHNSFAFAGSKPLLSASGFLRAIAYQLIYRVCLYELELELIQTQMTQKPMLRAEVYARALRASQNRKEDSL